MERFIFSAFRGIESAGGLVGGEGETEVCPFLELPHECMRVDSFLACACTGIILQVKTRETHEAGKKTHRHIGLVQCFSKCPHKTFMRYSESAIIWKNEPLRSWK